ncbi:MAG: hypothetical protein JO199_10125, partial [Candidatus Eremiobacteraeota bacterium]|nr:hypothetical protein [Candidatus Eremiobacteraeota bacterium]
MKTNPRFGAAVLAGALMSACTGGAQMAGVPALERPATSALVPKGNATVKFTIKVPAKPYARPHFISPSSQSLVMVFTPKGGGTTVTVKANLTASTPGCSVHLAATTCTIVQSFKPGTYTGVASTYDQVDQSGKELSHGDALALSLVSGQLALMPIVLGGLPHALTVKALGNAISGSVAAGFTVTAATAQALAIVATDADGNQIVAQGTPYAGTVVSGAGWKIQASPAPASPQQLTVTPPAVT